MCVHMYTRLLPSRCVYKRDVTITFDKLFQWLSLEKEKNVLLQLLAHCNFCLFHVNVLS